MRIRFLCNNEQRDLEIDPSLRAIDLLRDILGLTGTKEGCGKGECGACTILVNGKPVSSCIMLAAKLDGTRVETIEGVKGKDEELHPLQQAFLEEGAVQCGFCTPGMILSSKALLEEKSKPTEEEIQEALSGNFCRCTGYGKILKAVKKAGQLLEEKR